MLKIKLEFKKGILFIRLDGILNKKTIDVFDNEVLSVVLVNKLKYIVVNLDEVYEVDERGIDALKELNDIIYKFHGECALCSLTNNNVKRQIKEYDYTNDFYEFENELKALGMMNIWWI